MSSIAHSLVEHWLNSQPNLASRHNLTPPDRPQILVILNPPMSMIRVSLAGSRRRRLRRGSSTGRRGRLTRRLSGNRPASSSSRARRRPASKTSARGWRGSSSRWLSERVGSENCGVPGCEILFLHVSVICNAKFRDKAPSARGSVI